MLSAFGLLCSESEVSKMVETFIFSSTAMILYVSLFPDKKTDRMAHKKFRLKLAHQLVQPLLDSYADGTGGRKSGRTPVASDVRLKGMWFNW